MKTIAHWSCSDKGFLCFDRSFFSSFFLSYYPYDSFSPFFPSLFFSPVPQLFLQIVHGPLPGFPFFEQFLFPSIFRAVFLPSVLSSPYVGLAFFLLDFWCFAFQTHKQFSHSCQQRYTTERKKEFIFISRFFFPFTALFPYFRSYVFSSRLLRCLNPFLHFA